jgi:hypothetical protein
VSVDEVRNRPSIVPNVGRPEEAVINRVIQDLG